ncbi:MAG: tRNA 2-thiocytidine biosynthesis TtcA family protein [Leptospirales bacterium]|nr:tRNA 2-thiocytidine biosynthesis TtcA family protein [Leptospirales bacterium]
MKNKYLLEIEKTVGRAINNYSLIKEKDRVVVALSGGKDSLVMLDTISNRRKRLPIKYDILAVHVHVRNIGYKIDYEFIKDFCNEHNVSFHMIDAAVVETGHAETRHALSLHEYDDKTTPCFTCSHLRRKLLFDFVKEMKCNKLAFGHHRDDAVETLLMNMMFNSSISSIPPSLSMFDGEFDIIRPLILLGEDEIKKYAELKNFPPELKICPYSEATHRFTIKGILNEMEKINKNARKNIYAAMSNIHDEYLPRK